MATAVARSALVTLLVLAAASPASAATGFGRADQVERSATTGAVRFIGTAAGRPIARPAGFTASSAPGTVGRAYLRAHAVALGLGAADGLRRLRVLPQPRGGTTVRYQQVVGGVPVLAGEFAVTLDRANRIQSVAGEALPGTAVDTTPALSAAAAARRAIASVARTDRAPRGQLRAGEAALQLFDPRLAGGPGRPATVLVWSVGVHSTADAELRRTVLVDARRGTIVLALDATEEAKQRSVCDGNNVLNAQSPCTAPVLNEGGSYGGPVADVQPAYDYSGATYDMYASLFGRDSLDGAGL